MKRVVLLLGAMMALGTLFGAALMAWRQGQLVCHRMKYYDTREAQHSVTREWFTIYGFINYDDQSLEHVKFFMYPEVTICTVTREEDE